MPSKPTKRITSFDKGIPKDKWIPSTLWNKITDYMPMPCVDVIFEKDNGSILFGYRIIPPYKNVWALIGGRILSGERLVDTANRIANEYGMAFERLYLIGVFPIAFRKRADMVVSLAARKITGEPIVDKLEFSRMSWMKEKPDHLGGNYALMLSKWERCRESKTFLELNRLK